MRVPGDQFSHRDRCAIVGIGATDFSSASGRSELSLATQAALAALADAGLSATDVDGIVRCDSDRNRPNDLVHSLGIGNLTYFGEVGPGGVAPCAMVGQAVAAILSGLATTVLVFRALNGRSGRRFGLSPSTTARVGGGGSYDDFFLPYGLVTPGQIFAIMAKRHMIEFGTRPSLMRSSITTLPARPTATTLYKRAGVGPQDIDVAQLYDCFTITVLLQLEDYGFCAKGEGGPFAASGGIDLGGQIPINTGGGHLSEGYIHGMNHIVEGVRQMRGQSTSQVPGAEVCLVTSTPLPPGSAMIIRAA